MSNEQTCARSLATRIRNTGSQPLETMTVMATSGGPVSVFSVDWPLHYIPLDRRLVHQSLRDILLNEDGARVFDVLNIRLLPDFARVEATIEFHRA